METENNINFNPQPTEEAPKKPSNKSRIAIIILAIIALAGIGFGSFGLIQNNQKAQEIKVLQEAKINAGSAIKTEISTEPAIKTKNPADYIYIGEWGIKIKKPQDLKVTVYTYKIMTDTESLNIYGFNTVQQGLPNFVDRDRGNDGLGVIFKRHKDEEIPPQSPTELVYSDGEYNYYAYVPLDDGYEGSYDTDKEDWKAENRDLIYNMISNPENYSKI